MMVHFITEQFFRLRSCVLVKEAFPLRFQDRQLPSKSTIERNLLKYQRHATSLNRNKGNSGRRTVKSKQNIEAVRNQFEGNHHATARRNGAGLSKSSFNRITKRELHFHPDQMQPPRELQENEFQRRLKFYKWFVIEVFVFLQTSSSRMLSSFAMNGRVNTWNVREYELQGHLPPFNYDGNEFREKLVVRGGVCGNGLLLEPFFIEGNLTGAKYQVFPALMEAFHHHGNHFLRLWWAQEGFPPIDVL